MEFSKLNIETSFLKSLFENSPLSICITNLSGEVVVANKRFELLLGYSIQELKAMTVYDLTEPADIELSKKYMGSLFSGEVDSFSLEKRYIRKGGDNFWARIASSLVKNEEGEPELIIGFLEDISGEKRKAKEMRIHEERMNLAIQGTNDGVWDWIDLKSDTQWWSPRYFELLGYVEGEIESTVDVFSKELVYEEDIDSLWKSFNNCLELGIPMDDEYRLKTKNGVYKWFRGKGNVSKDENGKAIRMTGSISDIHERKLLEIELSETKNFLSKVTDIVPSIIYVINLKTYKVEYVSKEMGRMLGYSNKEVEALGSKIISEKCHPDDFSRVFSHYDQVRMLNDGETLKNEIRVKSKEGEYNWVLTVDASFERDKDGQMLKGIGFVTNINHIKKIEEELKSSADSLKEKNDELKQLNYVATHDLKMPILNIDGHFNFLKNHLTKIEDQDVQESISYVDDSITQFKTKISALTNALRIQNESFQLEPINILEVVKKKVKLFEHELDIISGKVDYDNSIDIEILGNKIYVRSILQNVINNSIKYNSEKRNLMINIIATTVDEMLCVVVADNGLGFDLALQESKLFGMFNRFHDHVEGDGMGLYMVKKMIELMGGKVEIESTEGVGTTIKLYFKTV